MVLDNLYFTGITNMYTAKPTIKRIKSQVTVWRKYLQMYKRIPFKIYEELKNSKIRKRVHCFFKSGHRCARWVTTEDTCQLSTWEMSMYFVRQMQIKTGTDHCPSVNTRPASSILRTLKTGEDIEWEKFIRGGEMSRWHRHWRRQVGRFLKN